eukprot:7006357-Pyramimonas_sp.AAC.1
MSSHCAGWPRRAIPLRSHCRPPATTHIPLSTGTGYSTLTQRGATRRPDAPKLSSAHPAQDLMCSAASWAKLPQLALRK